MSLLPTDPAQLDEHIDDLYELMKTEFAIEGKTKDEIVTMTKTRMKSQMEIIYQYIIDKMKIKGITVELDEGLTTVESFVSGTGDHHNPSVPGLDLIAGLYPVTGSVVLNKATVGTQNNDATGHVE